MIDKFENIVIFRAMVGSQAYGTATPTSDKDFKGVYIQPRRDLLTFNYVPYHEYHKDETHYEVRRFVELLMNANPTMLEILYSPKDCIQKMHSAFDILIQNRDIFLTKQCRKTFAGYAETQIKKAKGTDKMMNWEMDRVERKDVLDFCSVYVAPDHKWYDLFSSRKKNGKTIGLKTWLEQTGFKQEHCGLAALDHFRDCYALYHDPVPSYDETFWAKAGMPEALNYKGIVGPDSNEVRVSSIPVDATPEAIVHFNKDGYSVHCKDYRRYQEWLEKRNMNRLVHVRNHNQKIDGKNMLHCRRLLDVAYEIATEGTINVRRSNAEELLRIRRGEVNLQELIDKAEEMIAALNDAYEKSDLPDEVDSDHCNELIMEIRDRFPHY